MLFNFIVAILSVDPYEENYTKRESHCPTSAFSFDNYIHHYEQKLIDGQISAYKMWWYQINGDTQEIHLMDINAQVKLKKPIRYLNKSSETV